jgi:MFS family permease
MLRDARFYGLLPGLLAPAFIMTGVLFHQVHLVDVKGWTLAGFAASYPLYAGSATAASLGVGWLIDRYGAIQILPFYLLPLALSLALLGISDSLWAAAVFMTLMGATAGAATIVLGALLPELYGTAHLGAIRALSIALLVFATAISPGVIGWLIDQGLSLNLQFRVMSVYTVACAVSFALLLPSLRTYRAPPAFASRPFSMARQR